MRAYLLTLVIIFALASGQSKAEIKLDWSYYDQSELNLLKQNNESKRRESDYFFLQMAKNSLIAGNLLNAKYYANKVDSKNKNIELIRKRYQSLIYFLENDFNKSLDIISDHKFQQYGVYKHICVLKIMNLIFLQKKSPLQAEVSKCIQSTSSYSNNNQIWMTSFADLSLFDKDLIYGNKLNELKGILENVSFTETWFKLALYLNKEDAIINQIPFLPDSSFNSEVLRELIAFAYYRLGEEKNALEFIDGINTPNAENIRGNIKLKTKEYELALGHFKLALINKPNSLNSIERALPLSWTLAQWDEGIKLARKIKKDSVDEKKKSALLTAFYIQLEQLDKARALLIQSSIDFNQNMPLDLHIMNSYAALRNNEWDTFLNSSAEACKQYDGLNCYLQMQTTEFSNLNELMSKDSKEAIKEDFDIEKLKQKTKITSLKEDIFVNQKDIEELDGVEVRDNFIIEEVPL